MLQTSLKGQIKGFNVEFLLPFVQDFHFPLDLKKSIGKNDDIPKNVNFQQNMLKSIGFLKKHMAICANSIELSHDKQLTTYVRQTIITD